jgi:hypothetical protein
MQRLVPKVPGFDPLTAYVSFARAVSAGLTTERLCITRETLEKEILVQHFVQHYEMISSSIGTWRHTHDWLDTAELPKQAFWGWRG